MTEIHTHSEGIRQVLVAQYFLHEARHHPPSPAQDDQPTVVIPRAHTLADVYKCLHQGEFGIGHDVHDHAEFKDRLADELRAVPAIADEPILESIAPDDSIFRINLRPYKSLFADDDFTAACELLTQICVESAKVDRGSIERFFETLSLFRELNNHGELAVEGTAYAFPGPLLDRFLKDIVALARTLRSIPVLGHSDIYRYLNEPSYRVVEETGLKQSPLAFLSESS